MSLNRSGVQNSFNHNVRINNWNEDKELHALRMKEYLHRKATGQLLVNKVQGKLAKALEEVPLSFSKDGFIHLGDSVMLYSVATEGVLSSDPFASTKSSDPGFAVATSTLTHAHVSRNVFTIEGYGQGARPGDVLCLGQPFRIRAHSNLGAAPFYLSSSPASLLTRAKVTKQQEVNLVNNPGYDTCWTAVYKDPDQRFEMEGQPVPANAELVLLHSATRSGLASATSAKIHNDFGQEFEVYGHSQLSTRKKQQLESEMQGLTTTDIPVRAEAANNHWAFLTAGAEAEQPAAAAATAAATAAEDAEQEVSL